MTIVKEMAGFLLWVCDIVAITGRKRGVGSKGARNSEAAGGQIRNEYPAAPPDSSGRPVVLDRPDPGKIKMMTQGGKSG